MVKMLKAEYTTCESLKELADRLGVSISGLKYKAQKLCVYRRGKAFYWTEQQDVVLLKMNQNLK